MKFNTHHVAFTVNNLEESTKWYKEKLGFEITHQYKKDDMEFVLLEQDEVKIELFNFGTETKQMPEHRETLMEDLHVVGTKHLCIEVENLENAIKDFKNKGIEFVTEIDSAAFGGRYIFFKDCNGILIELYSSE